MMPAALSRGTPMLRLLFLSAYVGCTQAEEACIETCQTGGYAGGTVGGHPSLVICSCSGDGNGLTQEQCDEFCGQHYDSGWPHGTLESYSKCICGVDET